MRRYGPFVAAALAILVNTVALLGVAANRWNKPDAELTLTERELNVGHSLRENSALSLRLRWELWSSPSESADSPPSSWHHEAEWLDQAKLESIGFDCRKPLDDEDARLWYGKTQPRPSYAVLEYEGRAWQEWLQEQERRIEELRNKAAQEESMIETLEEREERFAHERVGHSRLFLVDAGSDTEILRTQYPDRTRYLILPALVRLYYRQDWDDETETEGKPYLQGNISKILISSVHVPRPYRLIIDEILEEERRARQRAAQGDDEEGNDPHLYSRYGVRPPRFEVTLRFGSRHEPWITGIHRITPENR